MDDSYSTWNIYDFGYHDRNRARSLTQTRTRARARAQLVTLVSRMPHVPDRVGRRLYALTYGGQRRRYARYGAEGVAFGQSREYRMRTVAVQRRMSMFQRAGGSSGRRAAAKET